jgi:hypothetical protein
MESMSGPRRYYGCDDLWSEVERRLSRTIDASTRESVDPDGSYQHSQTDYSEDDVFDLVARLANNPHPPPTKAEQKRERARSLARQAAKRIENVAAAVRSEVLPGGAPFQTASAAADWVYKKFADEPKGHNLSIRFAVRAPNSGTAGLSQLRGWLIENFPGPETQERSINELLREHGDKIVEITVDSPLLRYLVPDPESPQRLVEASIPAAHHTSLGTLQRASERLADDAGWPPVAATHFLLTGHILSFPSGIRVTRIERGARLVDRFVIEVLDPDSVSVEDVSTAYRSARVTSRPGASRATATANSADLLSFVEGRAGLPWRTLFEGWNVEYPEAYCKSPDALRQRYVRAQKALGRNEALNSSLSG